MILKKIKYKRPIKCIKVMLRCYRLCAHLDHLSSYLALNLHPFFQKLLIVEDQFMCHTIIQPESGSCYEL